jgi:hypothetical protein
MDTILEHNVWLNLIKCGWVYEVRETHIFFFIMVCPILGTMIKSITDHALRNMLTVMYNLHGIVINKGGPGCLNELGSWIT